MWIDLSRRCVLTRKPLNKMQQLSIIGCLVILPSCGLLGSQPIGYESQISLAEKYQESGQYRQSYEILDAIAQKHASSSQVNLDLAHAYFRTGALLKSEANYQKSIELGTQGEGNIGLGRVALARNEPDKAIRYFQTALVWSKNNFEALNGLAVGYDLSGYHRQAQSIYRKILEVDPTNHKALNNMGLSLVLKGSLPTAVSILTDLIESNRNSERVRHNLAIAYYISGRQEEAKILAKIDISTSGSTGLFSAVSNYRRNAL